MIRTVLMVGCALLLLVGVIVGFLYISGLVSINQQEEWNYKVTIRDDYDNLAGNTLELKVFDYLAEGYEIVDVTSGVGYIMDDYGSSMKVIGIVNGEVDDAYYTVTTEQWTTFSTCGLLFEILIEKVEWPQ